MNIAISLYHYRCNKEMAFLKYATIEEWKEIIENHRDSELRICMIYSMNEIPISTFYTPRKNNLET